MAENKNLMKSSLVQLCTFGILLLMAGILILLFSGTLFALLFDRRDLLFGLRLDGWAALISLFLKAVVESVLLFLIIRYPAFFDWLVKISLAFSGLLLVDSILTAKATLQGYQVFSAVPGVFFLLSAGLAILWKTAPAEGKAK
jgi:hypothetical protein